jgi:uncharacterized protein (DUF2141 family)
MLALACCTCGEPAAPSVPAPTLQAPSNGSVVSSLTPILAWSASTSGASYRLQVASDNNFSNLVVDAANLAGLSYSIPAGKLSQEQTYFWKVRASKDNQESAWSPYWSFQTPAPEPPPPEYTSNIRVRATIDGSSWTGSVRYEISGPQELSGSSVTKTFSNIPVGTYTVTYYSGGPADATFGSITPQPTQTTVADSTTTFTLNFYSLATSEIRVRGTLDGESWTGSVSYHILGPQELSGSSVSRTFSDLPVGTYTLVYNYGGPPGATLVGISRHPTQTTEPDKTTHFYLDFASEATSTVRVQATLDGTSWSGSLHFEGTGPRGESDDLFSVPETYYNMPAGTYGVSYISGGPAGAALVGTTPSSVQTVAAGRTITFTFNFYSEVSGSIEVEARLDGVPWSGPVSYTVRGPYTDSHNSVPYIFGNAPAGRYTITYYGGGPPSSQLVNITPHASQDLAPGDMIAFTLNFASLVAEPL